MPLNIQLDVPPVWRGTQFILSYPSLIFRLFLLTWNQVIKACANGSLVVESKPLAFLMKSLAYQIDTNHYCFLTGLRLPMIFSTNSLKFFIKSAGNPSSSRVSSILMVLSTASSSAWWIDLPFTWTWELRSIYIYLCNAHICRISRLIQIFPNTLPSTSFKYLAW